VNFPTRVPKSSRTAIDNIFIDSARQNSSYTAPIINSLSDHDAQFLIIIIFISINPVQSRMWKSQYKYKISSTVYNVNIVIEARKYIKQSDII
jgi:hypothetical protein